MCTSCFHGGLRMEGRLTSISQPQPQALSFLDTSSYASGMEVISHIPTTTDSAWPDSYFSSAGQIMAIGERRFLFPSVVSRQIIEITDAANPVVVNEKGAPGELAFHDSLQKWILIEPIEVPLFPSLLGKYEDPQGLEDFRTSSAFRGIRVWDVSDPTNLQLMSEFNTGETGLGAHLDGTYYDGGRYAYLAVGPDDSFSNQLHAASPISQCLMVVDMSDPYAVREVSRWWVPGQRLDEVAALKKWRVLKGRADSLPDTFASLEDAVAAFSRLEGFPGLDRMPYTSLHGPVSVPTRLEDGGRLGYGSWAALGFLIHDLSDVTKPELISKFDPTPTFGSDGIPMHTIWLGPLQRGFVVTIPEPINGDGRESWLPTWVVDVRDPTNPVPIAQLPRPRPPSNAPFADFTLARGRFGPHMAPHLRAPGRIKESFLALSYFNAGVRCYDLSIPTRPEEAGYFIPPHTGDLTDVMSTYRHVEDVSVEWDRNLIHIGSSSGLYTLSCEALGRPSTKPTPVAAWTHYGPPSAH